ncbi:MULTISPECIES: bifunctional glycosyltransferase family 2 protein/CDP-glycerol:glycerophosphate glycerophosphotransferase [unclassified Streptomyces]|uniref:bifunctional glycosyltransferase/CDP-glycerol:glycerophosphate glycerophosphotransferase n=1 Tax=unclassified Streptomyces TaxID=2593676 RepID=UPI00202F33AD|nr:MULTISPECIES: bifunctional glycosyltransferase family 2 protein/CDP-glycerol:glycerophosphate glycerophosphotransferase [unclassified Streptomyces]MCM1965954.1 bifunctional glycosyltransferase family 2 protein/CDP-glycerol:glycerophosphate glycerophosphotransferase [Streptomyces sp. G1]MCX5126613.1 bifunctional glycosyltransferase family 2 protein/CDP-glycerol:glycerophosphate glycerophosphotransferase [Streptomyces sp. NBC_00347]MCX5300247.1 bifunctional glycosyltransferase family 2 protein/
MPPRLSIVVPVYNVELYLDECLESIAAQTFDDFEVVLVDDGSTDGSAALAQAFADRDDRFRLVLQKNAGLGAARNVGARHISPGSEYLAFVDSDDTMPPYAYQRMIDALDETGSDFAAGNVKRFRSVGMQQSWGHRVAFAATRLKTHISKFPALVTDRTAWNKVYRRSFWDEHAFQYPEGILYEDAPVSIPAHYFAKSVDVIGECVYHWRVRETGERSITQRSTDPVSVIDRVTSVRLVREALQSKQGAAYTRYLRDYDRNVLSEELPLIYKYVPEAGAEFRAAFAKEAGGLVREIGPGLWPDLTVADRLKAYLAGEGRIEEFVALVQHQRDFTYSVPVKGLARPQADYPFLKAPVPAKVLTLGPRERRVVSRVEQAHWADGKLLLRGYALPGHLGAESRLGSRKMLVFRENGKRRRTVLTTRTVASPMATVNSPHLALRHADWAGFTAVIDPTAFQTGGKWNEGVWSTSVAVTGAGGLHRARLKGGEHDSGQNPPAHWVAPDVRIVPSVTGTFSVQVEIVRARALDVRPAGDDAVEVAGELAAEVGAGAALRAVHVSTRTALTFPLETAPAVTGGRIPFTVRVPLADLAAVPDAPVVPGEWSPEPWSLSVTAADGTEHRLAHDERAGFAGLVLALPGKEPGRALFAKRGTTGHLTFSVQVSPPLVDTVEAKDGAFTLRGRFVAPLDEPYELVLHDPTGLEFSYPVTRDGDTFEASFEPVLPESRAGRTPLPQGRWWPTLRPVSQGGATAGLLGVDRGAPLQFAPTALHAGPHAVTARGRRIRVESRLYDRVALIADPMISPHDRSRYAQRIARDVTYPAQSALPVKDIVVYDAFQGHSAGDSPRAIHEELLRRGEQLEHVWLVRDGRAEVPETARAVQYDSLESWDVLARARYYVVNDSVPRAFRRRPGQTVVQTWHGTPLKQIGHDFMHDYYTSPEVLDALEHDSAQWSLLASPGSYATPVLKRALGYGGEVIESGSPRTDALVRPDADRIADVRRRLGLPEGKKVVLYMPTWRENRLGWTVTSGYKLDLQIDLDAARRELGEDHILLIRGHHKVTEQVREGVRDGFVVDVSRWPDATDLLLVADVLISDYSSAIFDFAHTDRPVLLFAYDLEHYRDTLRGFTFDLEKKAPGPLLRDSASLIEAVRNVDAVGAEYAQARAAFREEFCDLDDGQAARRIVDRMLEM